MVIRSIQCEDAEARHLDQIDPATVDANGNLAGANVSYLGTRGYQVP